MLLNEFNENLFGPRDEKQWMLMEDIREYQSQHGIPRRIQILRALAKTKPFTRTVYPPNWKVS